MEFAYLQLFCPLSDISDFIEPVVAESEASLVTESKCLFQSSAAFLPDGDVHLLIVFFSFCKDLFSILTCVDSNSGMYG